MEEGGAEGYDPDDPDKSVWKLAHPRAFLVTLATLGTGTLVALAASWILARPALDGAGEPFGRIEFGVLVGLAFWTVLTLCATAFQVRGIGGFWDVSVAPIVAAMVLGGPLAAGLVAAIGTIDPRELRGEVPWWGLLANRISCTLGPVLGGFVFLFVSSAIPGLPGSAVATFAGESVFASCNMSILASYAVTGEGKTLRSAARELLPEIPASFSLAGVGWLMAIVAQQAWWGVLFFVVPLVALRSVYSKLLAVQEQERLKAEKVAAEAVNAQLTQSNALLALAARTDPLTGLGNRLRLNEDLAAIGARLQRHGGSAALLLLDLDRFKRLNDLSGHLAGDDALRRVATAMRCATRAEDSLYRYGGEEFLVILSDSDADRLCDIADRLVSAVIDAGIAHPDNAPWGVVTVSAGIAPVVSGEAAELDRALRAADDALYAAKAAGRNCFREAATHPGGGRTGSASVARSA